MRLALTVLLLTSIAVAECHSYQKAPEKLGEIACIRGKVVKVNTSIKGTVFLNFCEDYRRCPFAVVVFPRDLKAIGDVRVLEGREIEIEGKVTAYDGQAEIILNDEHQLRGSAAKLPKLPKDYDVSRRGSFSAGTFSSPSAPKVPRKKRPRDGGINPEAENMEAPTQ
jgi:DNA/RNA endonuclease YhcR with UshA esterase domain